MADSHARHPRWTAAALLAPASAAVFAASMSWMTGHSASAGTAAATSSQQPAANPLQAELDHRTAQVAALRTQVKGLRQQLAQASPAPSTTVSPPGGARPAVQPTASPSPKATRVPSPKTTRDPVTSTTKTKVTTAPVVTTTTASVAPPVVTTTTRAS